MPKKRNLLNRLRLEVGKSCFKYPEAIKCPGRLCLLRRESKEQNAVTCDCYDAYLIIGKDTILIAYGVPERIALVAKEIKRRKRRSK